MTPELDDMRVQARRLLDKLVNARWRFQEGDIRDMAWLRHQQADAERRLRDIDTLLTLCEQVHQAHDCKEATG